MTGPQVAIVIPVHNEGPLLREALEALPGTSALRAEVIVVDDGSTDQCCDFLLGEAARFGDVRLVRQARGGVAAARNRGAVESTAPYLVFLDGHCFPQPGWLENLLEALGPDGEGVVVPCIRSAREPAKKGYGVAVVDHDLRYEWLPRRGEVPYEIPFAGGGCMLLGRRFFERLGGFDAMRTFGVEDVELCLRAWLFGSRVAIVPRVEVGHVFKERWPYFITSEDYVYNVLRTTALHFDGDRRDRILDHVRRRPGYYRAVDRLLRSDIYERRAYVRANRRHDADWFCARFGIDL
jgi:GT2 family glycosyltransferase